MRIAHLSWEYPPTVYGGLGRHVHALAEAQAALGHHVTVITQAAPDAPVEETVAGVHILRAPEAPPDLPFDTEHLLPWTLALNHRLTSAATAAWDRLRPDVIHAHDWLVAQAADNLSRIDGTPIIATMHATEAGRHQGWLPTPLSRSIHSIESWLANLAHGVITCSAHMESEVIRLFDVPADSITVIPNGVDTHRWSRRRSVGRTEKWTRGPGPLLVYCGRLEWEKGVHTLVEAVPRLRRRYPDIQVVIAGNGSQLDSLQDLVKSRRITRRVHFTGWLPEPDLHSLLGAADALVLPSLYEPFGLVALEGAALGAPLAVARTGGLAEFAGADATAISFTPGDVADLARAVRCILDDESAAQRRTRAARRRLRERHSWPALASSTVDFYVHATQSRRTPRSSQPRDLSGNLLAAPSA